MLIPDNIDKFNSEGERIIYLKFKNDNSIKGVYILHSLFTNYHLKNLSGELDFLVLAPGHGIFAIEVKHGRVWRTGGTWHFEKKGGEVTKKNTSPFAQVNGTMNSIRKLLLEKIRKSKNDFNRFSKILFGTGIAFTSMNEFVDFGTEAYPWQLLTRSSISLPIGYYIDSLSKGWHNEYSHKYFYDVNLSRPTDEDCKEIIKILRGDFDINYSEINKLNDNEQLIEEYTKEQFSLLDFANYNMRSLIVGDAGTGKTIMALELTRRNILLGKKVALFCFNSKLGIKLSESIIKLIEDKTCEFYAGTLHSFLFQGSKLKPSLNGNEANSFYSEILPYDFLIRNDSISEDEKFDLLIIDEAQDLITPNYIEVFDSMLKGGIKSGNWVFLGDFSNQAIYLNDSSLAMDQLNTRTNFTKFPPLKINCRNTQKIALQNTLLTGIPKAEFTSRTIEGEEIVNKFPSNNNQIESIEEIIENLLKRTIPLHKITLLSPKRFENSLINNSNKVNKWLSEGLTFNTIHSFKGLENTFIILFDFDEISSIESQRLLYVGISRAKQKLYLVLNINLQEEYQKLIAKNIYKII
ncbi:MAG: NERD domain-containing protein [Ginsengibacter sp.]